MADLKENFKKWLLQQGTKSGTITSYLSRLQKISHKDWDNLTSNIIPFLVKYYELANKEYYLDCITILQALKYFNTISDNIYKNTNVTNESDIRLYLFDGKKDYFICDTDLKSLYDDVWLINRYLYESNDPLESKRPHNIDLAKLSILMLKVKENYRKDLKRIALHITYNNKGVQDKKTALTKYCNFLYATYKNANYNCKTNVALLEVQNKNPNKTIDGNYEVVQQISGQNPLQINAINECKRLDINFTLTKKDLSQIFDLDKSTVNKLLEKAKFSNNHTTKYDKEDYLLAQNLVKHLIGKDTIFGFETELRTYYNDDNINKYLRKHHHYHNNSNLQFIDYAKETYKYWCNRKEALKILGIGKEAFYNHSYKFTRLDYTSYTTKYYIPELEIIKNFPKIKRVQNRKPINSNR